MDCTPVKRRGQAGLSNPKGGTNVVDDRRGTDNSVAVGAGKQLHHGWVYPYFARRSAHCVRGRSLPEMMTLFTCWGQRRQSPRESGVYEETL